MKTTLLCVAFAAVKVSATTVFAGQSYVVDDTPKVAQKTNSDGTLKKDIFCDDCVDLVNTMSKHCTTGAPWTQFCASNVKDQPDLCDYYVKGVEKIFCPKDPCDDILFSVRHSPMALCNHHFLDCQNRPALNITELAKEKLTIGCDVCGPLANHAVNWCKTTGASTFDDFGGVCKGQEQQETCKLITSKFASLFHPEPACEGLKCQSGNPEGMCYNPAVACLGPDGKPVVKPKMPPATPAPLPPFVVYKGDQVIFGNTNDPKKWMKNGRGGAVEQK